MRAHRPDPALLLTLGVPSLVLGLASALLAVATPAKGATHLVWGWPVSPVRVVRTFSVTSQPYGPGHRGVDLRSTVGAPVVAPVSGVVTYAGGLAGRPLVAIMRTRWRVDLEPVQPSVKVGDLVTRGQVIGHLAAGTHCPASCLHWGVRNPNRVYVNPLVLATGRVRLWPVYANELRTNVVRNAPMGRLRRAGAPVRRPLVVARP